MPSSKGRAPQVLAMVCDVRKGEQVQALADAAMARFGAVHLVFNNAGVGSGGLIWENSRGRLGVGAGREPVGRDSWRAHFHAR